MKNGKVIVLLLAIIGRKKERIICCNNILCICVHIPLLLHKGGEIFFDGALIQNIFSFLISVLQQEQVVFSKMSWLKSQLNCILLPEKYRLQLYGNHKTFFCTYPTALVFLTFALQLTKTLKNLKKNLIKKKSFSENIALNWISLF